MSIIEKDHAHLSQQVYEDPDSRKIMFRAYVHVREEIPAVGTEPSVPLNGKRWAVYRSPDDNLFVLAFRGTKGMNDIGHDVNLINTPFGKHQYIREAARWSLKVMLFLASRCDDTTCLKFSLTGHSLGGTVAMGVLLLLHDVPSTGQYLRACMDEGRESPGGLPDYQTYADEILHPWECAKQARTGGTLPYEIVGGHIFNPGAWPNLAPGGLERAATAARGVARAASRSGGVSARVGVPLAGLAFVAALVEPEIRHMRERRRDRDVESVDKLITTHHMLGDPFSNNFGLGREKSYAPTALSTHTIENFL